MKIFVSTIEFCRRNKSHKIKSDYICATFCGDKILLLRQRFPSNSPLQTTRFVPATCRATCCINLSPSLIPRRPRSFAVPFASLPLPERTSNDLGRLRIRLLIARPVPNEGVIGRRDVLQRQNQRQNLFLDLAFNCKSGSRFPN